MLFCNIFFPPNTGAGYFSPQFVSAGIFFVQNSLAGIFFSKSPPPPQKLNGQPLNYFRVKKWVKKIKNILRKISKSTENRRLKLNPDPTSFHFARTQRLCQAR
jgi:hypothetical protein